MTLKKTCLLCGLALLTWATSPVHAAPSTDNINTLQRSTCGSTATWSVGTDMAVAGTLGQGVSGGGYKSTMLSLRSGFWPGGLLPVIDGDLNDDGRVGLEDVISGLHGLTGQGTDATRDADVDGDGKVSPAELIHIMREQIR